MATGGTINLTPSTAGTYHVSGITTESAKKASELLQRNHDENHIFFNKSGFHNHIAHHLLAIYALGATPDQLQRAFDINQGYQRPQFPLNERNVQDLADPKRFDECLGKEKYFHDFEAFFRKEIDSKGYKAVIKSYLLQGDARANDLLYRTYAGFYHPLIHLGYGIEFQQPAIIAEALAQAAVHDNWTRTFLEPLDTNPPHLSSTSTTTTAKKNDSLPTPLPTLLTLARTNPTLLSSVHSSDGNKVRDGVLARGATPMLDLARRWFIPRPLTPESLATATAEMVANAAWFAGAAQREGKAVKFDFFYMHCVNASVFFSAFLEQGWMTLEEKARLLEWKVWLDLVLYVSRGCPELRAEEVRGYQGREEGWEGVVGRVLRVEDDGHAAKLVRALGNGGRVCGVGEEGLGEERMMVRGEDWLKLGNMAVDSVESDGPRWVRNAGFEEAWTEVPDRAQARL